MDTEVSVRAHSLSRRQGGVVTREQLRELGVPRRTLDRRIRHRQWIAVGCGVLVAPGTPDSLATRSRIVGLQVPKAVLTGPSTAALTGGRVWEGVTLGRLPWLIHDRRSAEARYLTHPAVRARRIGPWRVACASDAVVDMIRLLPPSESRALAYRAIQCRVLSINQLAAAARHLAHFLGSHQLRAVLVELREGTRSEAERRLVRLVKGAGICGWKGSYRVETATGRYELDLAIPRIRFAVEVDGYAFHSARDRFLHDRRRQNDLVVAGWMILRFTWDDLTAHPERTIQLIREAIEVSSRIHKT